MSNKADPPIPVTVLSGFLGSGKTTLLKYILESHEHEMKIAVIVNDMAELNIDAAAVVQQEQHSNTKKQIEQMFNTGSDGEEKVEIGEGGKGLIMPPPSYAALEGKGLITPPPEYSTMSEEKQEEKQEEAPKAKASHQIVKTEREVVSLQNGCICCTLRGDLIREIARIRSMKEFDYVLIESTGIAEPQPVAEAFCFDPNTAQLAKTDEGMLWKQARLDTCVTVIDAHQFRNQTKSLAQFSDVYTDGLDTSTPEGIAEGQKSIATLVVDQVEFANVILLNKTDLVTEKELEQTVAVIRTLNPTAKLIPTEYAKVDLNEILNTHRFDLKAAAESPGWLLAIKENGGNAALSHGEVDEYGVGSFVFRSRIAFHPKKLVKWMDGILHFASEWKNLPADKRDKESDKKHENMVKTYGNIIRAKGFCWLAGHDSFMFGLAQSGRIGGLAGIMPWYTLIPKEQWGVEDPKDLKTIEDKFEGPHGDRRQEIVFIGTDLKVDAIREALEACLLTKKEFKQYKFYSDKGYMN